MSVGRPGPGRRILLAWHRRRSRCWFISFPKSGRTWTKRVLEAYFADLAGVPPFDYEHYTPAVRIGPWRAVPRIVFVHPHTRGSDAEGARRFIAGLRNRRVILMVRDPRDTVVSYWFRLRERMGEDRANSLSLKDFAADKDDGLPRIVDFLNTWRSAAETIRDLHVVRFEDLAADPLAGFSDMLQFLGARVDDRRLAAVIARVPDTTTKGLESRGPAVTDEDRTMIDTLTAGLRPAFGYDRTPGGTNEAD